MCQDSHLPPVYSVLYRKLFCLKLVVSTGSYARCSFPTFVQMRCSLLQVAKTSAYIFATRYMHVCECKLLCVLFSMPAETAVTFSGTRVRLVASGRPINRGKMCPFGPMLLSNPHRTRALRFVAQVFVTPHNVSRVLYSLCTFFFIHFSSPHNPPPPSLPPPSYSTNRNERC